MTRTLDILARVLAGALTRESAAESLGVPAEEMDRMIRAVGGEGAVIVPVSADVQSRRIDFLDLSGTEYREPFFSETIEQARRKRPELLNFDLDFDGLAQTAMHFLRPPDGLLYHCGRCGSTLLANMLAKSGEHLLIKEPDLVNDLMAGWLNARHATVRAELGATLGCAIRVLLGSTGNATGARHRVLKTAAWNIRLADLLSSLFQNTRAVFLYRSPLEVVASLLFQAPSWFPLIKCPRTVQTRFFPTLTELPPDALLSPCSLFAHGWLSAAEAALRLPPERLLVVEYDLLQRRSELVISRVLEHLGHANDRRALAAMAAMRASYAKDPEHGVPFNPRGEHSRPPLSAAQETEVLAIVGDSWERLARRALADMEPA